MKKIENQKENVKSKSIKANIVTADNDEMSNLDRHPERIPESQGDLADRAEEEIENEIRGRIEQIRRESRSPGLRRDRH